MSKFYVMLARFPKGHVMDGYPGPLMVIPEERWNNFKEAIRPSLSAIGVVQDRENFMSAMREFYPEVAARIEEWGRGIEVQIWLESVESYRPIARRQMTDDEIAREERKIRSALSR